MERGKQARITVAVLPNVPCPSWSPFLPIYRPRWPPGPKRRVSLLATGPNPTTHSCLALPLNINVFKAYSEDWEIEDMPFPVTEVLKLPLKLHLSLHDISWYGGLQIISFSLPFSRLIQIPWAHWRLWWAGQRGPSCYPFPGWRRKSQGTPWEVWLQFLPQWKNLTGSFHSGLPSHQVSCDSAIQKGLPGHVDGCRLESVTFSHVICN